MSSGTNAGVHAGTGFEFQKHCALYLLIENWEEHKNKKYFITIEHHDDFLFCYQSDDGLIEKIKTYQAKKSSDSWTLNKKLYEILQKILQVGQDLKSDPVPKSSNYSHNLYFISNNYIKIPNNIVNESNKIVKYSNLSEEQQKQIAKGIEKINSDLSEINNLHFHYIDLAKTSKEQKRQLIGLIEDIFEDQVNDPKAAVYALLGLFREIELTFNQGSVSRLLDKSKQVDSNKIKSAINIITTKSKAFDLWRDKKSEISIILKIPISQQKDFEMHFENSFDFFKDITKTEHQNIFQFAQDKIAILGSCYTDEDCIENLYELMCNEIPIRQSELYAKAALFAAYVEIKERQ